MTVSAVRTIGTVGAVDLVTAISALELGNSLIPLLVKERLGLLPDSCIFAVWEL